MNSDAVGSKKNLIVSIILIVYVVIDLIRVFNVLPPAVFNIAYVSLGFLAILYSVYIKGIKKQLSICIFLFFYTLFGLVGIIVNKNIDFQEVLWPIAFLGISLLLLNFKLNYKLAQIIYYSIMFILITTMIISGGVNNVDMTSSRNTISVIVLFYFSIYVISMYTNNVRMTFFPIIIGLITTLLAVGRSGIITFLIITFFFFLIKYDNGKYKRRRFITSLVIIMIVAFVSGNSYSFLEIYFPDTIANFQDRGLESVREFIWSDYINKAFSSTLYLLFGAPIGGTFLLERYNDNLHNSFLMLHAKYGLFVYLSITLLVIYSFYVFIKKHNIVYPILLLAILFRMQFDYTNFNAQLDIIFFYIIFYPFYVQDTYNERKI